MFVGRVSDRENIQQIHRAIFLALRTGDHSPRATLRSYFAYRHSEARFCLWVSNLSRASGNLQSLESEIRGLILNFYLTFKKMTCNKDFPIYVC